MICRSLSVLLPSSDASLLFRFVEILLEELKFGLSRLESLLSKALNSVFSSFEKLI